MYNLSVKNKACEGRNSMILNKQLQVTQYNQNKQVSKERRFKKQLTARYTSVTADKDTTLDAFENSHYSQ